MRAIDLESHGGHKGACFTNTRLAAPEFHRPDWKNDNYTGPEPYDMSLVGIQSAADQTGGAA